MRLGHPRAPYLAYEMNVHPSESLAEFRDALRRFTVPVRDRLREQNAGSEFAISPRFGEGLLHDLRNKRARSELATELRELQFVPISVNAFPLENFHADTVKSRAYSPPWTRKARVKRTNEAIDLLHELLPEETRGSVSTLGGTYRPWRDGRATHHKIAGNYLETVAHAIQLYLKTGRKIVLAAEPEPDTTFETAADVVQMVDEHLLPQLRECIARPLMITPARAEELFREFFTVNLDVCHQSVLFRDPVDEWQLLDRHGIRVGKLHITSAIVLRRPGRSPAAVAELRDYDEPRYLHQFAARHKSGTLVRGSDLGELPTEGLRDLEEVRVHFHVPVSRAKIGKLTTTRDDTERAIHHALRQSDPPDLVIETYTWPLLAKTGDKAIVDGICREFRWAASVIDGVTHGPRVAAR